MMPSRDLVRHFKAAAWTVPQEIRAFAVQAGALPPGELLPLIPLLVDRALVGQGAAHRNRCAAFAALVERSPHEDLFLPCVKALKSADSVLRAALVALLPKVNSNAGHAELCQLLGSPETELRKSAAMVLRQVAGRTAFQVLSDLIAHPSFAGRIEALEVLVPRAGVHCLPLLATTLRVGKPQERLQALRYLAEDQNLLKDRAAALRIAAMAIEDAEERVAAQAILAFGAVATEDEFFQHIGARIDDPSSGIVRAVIEALRHYRSRRVVSALARKLRLGPNPVRVSVLESLEQIGGNEVLSLLVEALGHKQQVVRNKAAEVLWRLNQKGEVDLSRTVLWLLRSHDVNVRRMAVELAKKIGDPRGELAPKLVKHLRDEDWWVRERVIDAVVEMIGPELTRHVVEFLQDPSDVVRRWAIGALIRIRDPRSLGALVRSAMEDGDWWVRERAIEAVAALNDPRAIPYLVNIVQRMAELRVSGIEALAAMNAKEAASRVAPFTGDPDPEVRLATIRCLETLDDKTQAIAVRACIRDPDARVHRAASALLTRWDELRAGVVADPSAKLLERLLVAVAEAKADDLVLIAGQPPYLKASGIMSPLNETPLSAEELENHLRPHLTREQQEELQGLRDIDFSYEVVSPDLRFRANVFRQNSGLGAVFRSVKNDIPRLEDLGLPPIVSTFGNMRHGLVLVGGPTGSGKSTTLAAIIGDINRRLQNHIITFEDPIEALHERDQSLINQREVGTHIADLGMALRATLRQDPDVILMGEMRDLATISFAITAAETGHLVFGTVHTVSADTTVDRLVNAFPSGQQAQVRSVLAEALRAVVCQHLLRGADGKGRVLAVEVMLNTDAVATLIRKGKAFQIPSVIATSREVGMQSMDSELIRLLKEGRIYPDEAYMKAFEKKLFEPFLEGDGKPAPEASKAQPAIPRAVS
jgi:twitching motility protein PilT